MGTVRSEYHRFLEALTHSPVQDDVRRMANVVMQHLDVLAEVGTGRRARSVRLAPLAIRDLLQAPVEPPLLAEGEAGALEFDALHELSVGPFRGFMSQETFDLSQKITLVYGANGTGKSSFCEALETAMLGSISEAREKRVDHRVYCNNARLGRHVPPQLTVRRAEAAIEPLQPSEEAFRFCFIEKNRLDDFARIAARTPGDQRQLIATLFGVDQFSDFVRGFNPDLDQELNLEGTKAIQLASNRQRLAASEQALAGNDERIAQFVADEHALSERYFPGSNFDEVCLDVLGNGEAEGRLALVKASLDTPAAVIYGVTRIGLIELLGAVRSTEIALHDTSQVLAARAVEVSYSKLYSAVLELSGTTSSCPACGTRLDLVEENPFDRAQAGMQQLAELASLQNAAAQQQEQVAVSLRALHAAMTIAIRALTALVPVELAAAGLPALLHPPGEGWIRHWMAEDRSAWTAFIELCEFVERFDAEAREQEAQRAELRAERACLEELQIEIERCRTVRATHAQAIEQALLDVAQFENANRELIAEVEAEGPIVLHHLAVKLAYDNFLVALREYLANLPAQLLQGLGEGARDLYNSFNRDDRPGDQLSALWLPLAENGKIELEFVSEPGVRYDALVILSEGHIKCLGLAILLAKNIEQGCQVVIFDDVVNAIDDEHRNGIWRTFFEGGLLDQKQVILTSHAEEFLLRIQQELGAARAQEIKLYKFLPHLGEHELRVDASPTTKNYVLLAQQSLAAEEKRDALRHSRPALESLTDRLWTWMGKRGIGRIELQMNAPRSPVELNNKCVKIRAALRRLQGAPAPLAQVIGALDNLLSIGGNSIEWGYLNGGTHDSQRDGEFDRATVRTIVEAMTSIDVSLAELARAS